MSLLRWMVQVFAFSFTTYFSPSQTTATAEMSSGQPRQAIKQDDIVILKIGGSSITNKAEEETLNHEALDWFSKLVAGSINPSFLSSDYHVDGKDEEESNGEVSNTNVRKRQFIVVHGAGSFGHHSAKRYGLRCGKAVFLKEVDNQHRSDNAAKRRRLELSEGNAYQKQRADRMSPAEVMQQRYQMLGLAKTRQSVQKLNAVCVSSLIQNGVNAVGISPGVSFQRLRAHGATALPRGIQPRDFSRDDSPQGMHDLVVAVKGALRAGLVPVVHGDACLLYDGLRAGILGGDTIAEGLARLWDREGDEGEATDEAKCNISKVMFITDVAGVFTSDPKTDKNAKLIRRIKVDKDTGELTINNQKEGGDGREPGGTMNVSGSSHSHDVTGGLNAKLGAAVTIVQAGIDVIISQCCARSTETLVKGGWGSILDVEAGTLLTQ